MNRIVYLLLLSVFFVASCKNEEPCESCEAEKQMNDSLNADQNPSLEQALLKEADSQKMSKDEAVNHEKIVEKYGEQWDFCACVVANDSINKAFAGDLSDAQTEKLMSRWEHVELKCKEFLTQPNTTPEERARHEKKVKKCLKGH
ncbi:MAG: hypothetical protein EP338_14450 [Bacteroidetes bacterium]|nr:MAG: hypothetical protein EP338_14450 [Bacteroidota bacterium]